MTKRPNVRHMICRVKYMVENAETNEAVTVLVEPSENGESVLTISTNGYQFTDLDSIMAFADKLTELAKSVKFKRGD